MRKGGFLDGRLRRGRGVSLNQIKEIFWRSKELSMSKSILRMGKGKTYFMVGAPSKGGIVP